jgi:hypothetical protein
MALTEFDSAEVRAHWRTFVTFERLVLFAVMHITLALIAGFVVAGTQSEP